MAIYNDTYIESSFNQSNNLDSMARSVNDTKKKKITDVYDKFRLHKSTLTNELNNLIKNDVLHIDNTNIGNTDGFYSAQGEYLQFNKNKHIKNDEVQYDVSINDVPSIDVSCDSTLVISDTDIAKEIVNKSKLKKKHQIRRNCVEFDLDSADSIESLDSSESLLDHVQNCAKCKHKLTLLIKKHKFGETLHDNNPDMFIKNNDKTNISATFCNKEIKEIVVIVMIGILIIIVVDIIINGFA